MMQPFRVERTQLLGTDIDTAWRFFCDPRNLVKITPPDMDFRITSPAADDTYAGQIITYSVRPLFRVAVNWTTEITHLDKPHFFVDEQRFGPYRFWHHQHHFRPVEGGVEMTDLVHYLLPHDQLAWLINRLIVAPRLKRIFDYRSQVLSGLFPAQSSDTLQVQGVTI